MGLLEPPLVLKFFIAEHAPYGLPPGAKSVHTYAGLLDELMGDTERVWFVHCYGATILPMAAEAIALGGRVRIGLGEHLRRREADQCRPMPSSSRASWRWRAPRVARSRRHGKRGT